MYSLRGFKFKDGTHGEITWIWKTDLDCIHVIFSILWCSSFVILCKILIGGQFQIGAMIALLLNALILMNAINKALSVIFNETKFTVTPSELHVETKPIGEKKTFPLETLGKIKVFEKPKFGYPRYYGVRSNSYDLGIWFRNREHADFLRLYIVENLKRIPRKKKANRKKSLTRRQRQHLHRTSSCD